MSADNNYQVDSTLQPDLNAVAFGCPAVKTDSALSWLYQSSGYRQRVQRLDTQQNLIVQYQQAGETARALRLGAELEHLQRQQAAWQETLCRIDNIFTSLEVKTPRLTEASIWFYQGQFQAADRALEAWDMAHHRDELWINEPTIKMNSSSITQKKLALANEYLVKALLQRVLDGLDETLEPARAYFETAIALASTPVTLFEYALFLHNHQDFESAQRLYQDLVDRYRALAAAHPEQYAPTVALACNNLAHVQSAQTNNAGALTHYGAALVQYQTLAESDWHTYLPYVAMTLNNLASLQLTLNDGVSAQANYEAALSSYRLLAIEAPDIYLPYVAMTLNNVANVQMGEHDFVHAQANYELALHTYQRLAETEPDIYLADVAMALCNLALLQATLGDAAAAAHYESALQRYRQLANKQPQRYLPDVAHVLTNWANLQADGGDFAIAQANYEAALAIYRQLATVDADTYLPEVASALNNLANVQVVCQAIAPAQANYEAALQLSRQLAAADPLTYALDEAMTFINVSIFYADTEQNFPRSRDLAMEAYQILQSQPDTAVTAPYLQLVQEMLQAHGVNGEEPTQEALLTESCVGCH
jgi:tetratricopeptide (TPR) repeat protein